MMRVDLAGWSLILIAMAMGYLVCVKAVKVDSKALEALGFVIGIVILTASLALAVFDVYTRIRIKRGPMFGSQRPAGMTTKPVTPPKINIPAVPKAPKTAVETAPTVPSIPNPPAAPKTN